MDPLLWSLASFCSTAAGGLSALLLRGRLRQLLGFTAGALLGVVAFDLLPETLALAQRSAGGVPAALLALAAGGLLVHALQRSGAGLLPVAALIGHSLLDGVGIGLAFQVSPATGLLVALAVVAHDFCDGLGTVGLMLARRHGTAGALALLALDAVAPLIGAAATIGYGVSPGRLALGLAFFAGLLLHVGLTNLLRPWRERGAGSTVASPAGLALLGASFVYLTTRLAP